MTLPRSITPRLGCATDYTAEIWHWDRVNFSPPRARLVTQLSGIIQLYWERTIDDYSEARVRFRPIKGDDCCTKLAPKWDERGRLVDPGIWPWSHELVLYRDGEPVWTGPVFSYDETARSDETSDFIQINARDHLAWLDRRVIHNDMPFGGNSDIYDLTQIAEWIVKDALAPDNVGITDSMIHVTPSGRRGRRVTRHWEARSGDELREVARGGIDYTCIGRQIFIKGVRRDPSVFAPELRNRDFQSGMEIRIVGAEAGGVGYAVGKPPDETKPEDPPVKVRALAPGMPANGIHPYFGLIEALTNASTSSSIDFLTWMAHELVDENMPPPRTLSIPAGSLLSPEANVSIHDLIPSRHFKINIKGTCLSLSQYMRLSHMECSWEPGIPERVGVTFIPGNVEVTPEDPT